MYIKFLKRFLDIIISIIAIPFFFIVLIIVAPLIYLEDKGTIFYNALRLGKGGRCFKMYKLRSMKVNAPDIRLLDGSTYNSEDDPRVTQIGKILRKTSLDEMPQIINILKGDMSIVGPRPDLPEGIDIFEDEELLKLDVRPGLTGYNQAYFRNSIPVKMRFANDVFYIKNLTFIFDVKIIFKTIIIVLFQKNIFSQGNQMIQVTKDVQMKQNNIKQG